MRAARLDSSRESRQSVDFWGDLATPTSRPPALKPEVVEDVSKDLALSFVIEIPPFFCRGRRPPGPMDWVHARSRRMQRAEEEVSEIAACEGECQSAGQRASERERPSNDPNRRTLQSIDSIFERLSVCLPVCLIV